MMTPTIRPDAQEYLDKHASDDLQEEARELAKQLTGKDRTHDASRIADLLKESDGKLACRVNNVGATPFFRWHPDAEQFERIITYSAPQSHPKKHRETPRDAIVEYLGDCAPYTIQIVAETQSPFPPHEAYDWLYKWPRHSNEHCVYGVVTNGGMDTWYFERVASDTDEVTLVGVERWLGDTPEQTDRTVSVDADAIPAAVLSKLEEQNFSYRG